MARKGGQDRGITQRKDRKGWWVRHYANGRQQWFKCDTKSQAKALYGRLKADIREGTFFPEKFAPRKDITLRAWILRCLEGSTNRDIVNERRYGRRWSLLLGKRMLDDVSRKDLRQVQTKMRARLKVHPNNASKEFQSKRRWSDATINRHFAFLRHVLMLAVKDGKLTQNPVSGLKFFPEMKRTRWLAGDELERLRGVMQQSDWKLVAFAIETGLRRGEQFRLRWDQVDLENGVLTLPLPKGGKTRHVPLSEEAKAILRSFDSFLRSAWVFPGVKDVTHPMDSRAFLRRSYEPGLRQAGITGSCWHSLRHTAASRRIMAGVDLVSVKEILGHRDIQTTLRYAHLAPGHLRDAVNRGSLIGTVTKTVTTQEREGEEEMKPFDLMVRPEGIEPPTPGSEVLCSSAYTVPCRMTILGTSIC
ncbi:MAG: tyrosine-type recombinase/integrase [Nitrospirales bacterium]